MNIQYSNPHECYSEAARIQYYPYKTHFKNYLNTIWKLLLLPQLKVSTVLNFYRLTCSASPVYRIYYTAVTGVYCPQFLPPHLLRLTGLPDLLHGCYRCLLSSL